MVSVSHLSVLRQAQLEAPPEKGHASINSGYGQLPVPLEETQATVPPGQAQLEAPPEKGHASIDPGGNPAGGSTRAGPATRSFGDKRPSIFPIGGLTGDIDIYDIGEPYKPSDSDRRCMITDILSAPDDPNTIRHAWERNIPDNCNLNYKQLMAILHPDRVPTSDKADAEKAFQSENH
ncbi:hypothetical protein N7516_000638 [Penicillium verrucosum]|uniref:uncharacterized protein n=1 Tax=Penicillium verrucosum TaxID=60171 RepID=UPI0025457589|nr:uncharacterized protein N7516_000638 [Penicillium verrucosum]KAJ5940470.1 hypothetical protein N7516_000638 [Penicillium verrucosum]